MINEARFDSSFVSRLEVLSPWCHGLSLKSMLTFFVQWRKTQTERQFPRRDEDGWQNQMKMAVDNKEATGNVEVPRPYTGQFLTARSLYGVVLNKLE